MHEIEITRAMLHIAWGTTLFVGGILDVAAVAVAAEFGAESGCFDG